MSNQTGPQQDNNLISMQDQVRVEDSSLVQNQPSDAFSQLGLKREYSNLVKDEKSSLFHKPQLCTKKQKLFIGIASATAALALILGLSIGLTGGNHEPSSPTFPYIPSLRLKVNQYAINTVIQYAGPLFDSDIAALEPIQLPLSFEKKLLGLLNIGIANLTLHNHTFTYENMTIEAGNQGQVLLHISGMDLNLSGIFHLKVLTLLNIKETMEIYMKDIKLEMKMLFQGSDQYPLGMVPSILEASFTSNITNLHVSETGIIGIIINLLLTELAPAIPGLFNAALNNMNPILKDLADNQLAVTLQNYRFEMVFPKGISSDRNQALYIPIKLNKISNQTDNRSAPQYPQKDFTRETIHPAEYTDISANMGSSAIKQILWVLTDSNYLDAVLNDTSYFIQTGPFRLNTTDLQDLIPALYEKEPDCGIYLGITLPTGYEPKIDFIDNNFSIRITVRYEFIVDKNISDYLKQNVSTCLQEKNCNKELQFDLAIEMEGNLFFFNKAYLGGKINKISFSDVVNVQKSEKIFLGESDFLKKLNQMYKEFLPILNDRLKTGIEIPEFSLIELFPIFQSFEMDFGDDFCQLGVQINTNPLGGRLQKC